MRWERERERDRQTDRQREREREVGPIPTFHVRIGGLKDFNVALIARVIDFSFGLCLFHGVRAKSESPLDLHDGPGSLQMPGCSHCVLPLLTTKGSWKPLPKAWLRSLQSISAPSAKTLLSNLMEFCLERGPSTQRAVHSEWPLYVNRVLQQECKVFW